jgi:hypothetical protein
VSLIKVLAVNRGVAFSSEAKIILVTFAPTSKEDSPEFGSAGRIVESPE